MRCSLALSLGSVCKFRFRRNRGTKWERFTLEAQPRSLYAMTGEARHGWVHSIPPVETSRWSITLANHGTVGHAPGRDPAPYCVTIRANPFRRRSSSRSVKKLTSRFGGATAFTRAPAQGTFEEKG